MGMGRPAGEPDGTARFAGTSMSSQQGILIIADEAPVRNMVPHWPRLPEPPAKVTMLSFTSPLRGEETRRLQAIESLYSDLRAVWPTA
jgi:hypothetical protein